MNRPKSKPMDLLELLAAAATFQSLPQDSRDKVMDLLLSGKAT